MLENISNLDKALFLYLNSALANTAFDAFFPFITKNSNWYAVWILLCGLIIWYRRKNGVILVLCMILGVALSDFVSSKIIKEFVGRPRPCHTMQGIRLLVDCGAGKSFPSSHAVNNFFAAVFLSSFFKRYTWLFFLCAVLVAFSRVYVGVHYPLDIFCGGLIGSLFGYATVRLTNFIINKTEK